MRRIFAWLAITLALVDIAAFCVWHTYPRPNAILTLIAQPRPIPAPPAASDAVRSLTAVERVDSPAPSTAPPTPGGCKSKESCATYCSDITHKAECRAFASLSSKKPQNDSDKAQNALPIQENSMDQRALEDKIAHAPPEVRECVHRAQETQRMENMRQGRAMTPTNSGPEIDKCFKDASNGGDAKP